MAAPVKGFLNQVDYFVGKPVVILFTHFFRRAWGAEQTVQSLAQLLLEKGASVVGDLSVRWLSLNKEQQISQAGEKLVSFFQD